MAATTENGMPYLVMEYIQGQPIDVYCEQKKLGIRERVDLVRTLCGAVHYVHQHLMVHGDLKCNNVLVTERGVLKLLDFGIAKLLNPDAGAGWRGGIRRRSLHERLHRVDPGLRKPRAIAR